MPAKGLKIARHCFSGIVAFRYGNAEQPRGLERSVGETVDGEFYSVERLGIAHEFAIHAHADADIEPIFGMGLVCFPDQIFAFLFDRLGQPHAAHFGVRAVIEDRVFFDRHLLGNQMRMEQCGRWDFLSLSRTTSLYGSTSYLIPS